MILVDKFKSLKNNLLGKKHEDDDFEIMDSEVAPGEINISDDINPEDRAKTVKKKAVIAVASVVGILAVSSIVSHALTSQNTNQTDKPLSTATNTAKNPTNGLPDKYSDMGKYEKDASKTNNIPPNSSNRTGTQNQTTSNRTYAATPVQTSRSSGATYVPTTYAVAPSYGGGYNGGNSASSNDRAAEQAAKEKEAVINSALAFKVAAAISQGQSPEITPLANATGTPTVQEASYRFSDESMPESSGSYALAAGTVIPATLLTGITSDVPNGDVVAQIRQNVYDSLTGTHLLIPQGSRLIGVSGAAGKTGNKRIGVVFKRIILPNGASLTLPDQKAIDGTGYPGLEDIYSDHRGRAYGSAFTSALFGALAQSATGNTSGSDTRSPGQEAVSGAVASILQTGQKMVEQDLNQNATIEIEPGFQFSVFINQDLLIGDYVDI